jgi:mannose-6-phosphate isomerase-like protein (cupin superfamily)
MGDSGVVVRAGAVTAVRTQGGASVRTLLGWESAGSSLVRRLADVPASAHLDYVAGGCGELWFVITGQGVLEAEGDPIVPKADDHPGVRLCADRAIWIPPGGEYRARAGDGSALALDIVALPASISDAPGSAGPHSGPTLLTADLDECEVETTGDRQFRVLFGPGRGCSVATQFVGDIPPGRAPAHSHPYDEMVLVLAGRGIAHIGGADHELAPGTCMHLPPGLPHCLENTGSGHLRVLGVFHPADTPAAKLEE